ncbi:hypothetical protein KDL44_02565 [bacterium]|nr:hypothetical protein [bacterium]
MDFLLLFTCITLIRAGILFALEFALLQSVLLKFKSPPLTRGFLAKLALIATGCSLPPGLLLEMLLRRSGFSDISLELGIVMLSAAGWFVSGLVPPEQGRGDIRRIHLVVFLVSLTVMSFTIFTDSLTQSIINSP